MTTPSDEQIDAAPVCIASTEDTFSGSSNATTRFRTPSNAVKRYEHSRAFREARFSGDGTTLITQHEDQHLRTFVLPVDLLDETKNPQRLTAHCSLLSPTPIQSYSLYPHFRLEDPSTTVVACASNDLPIHLRNALYPGTVHASYPLINATTEAYITPNSLAWSRNGSHLITGSKDLISIFDSSYDGHAPLLQHKTAVGKAQRKLRGPVSLQSCRGIVSALSISQVDGVLAAGTTQRDVGLFAHEGSGECITSFSVAAVSGELDPCKGDGIMQLAWSPCGTYLLVAERQSDCVQVYDVRNTLSRVSWLTERHALTTQRMGISVKHIPDGCEVWAGGTDGCVRVWKNPGSVEGQHLPDSNLQLHTSPVHTAIWHFENAVLATCSGTRFTSDNIHDGSAEESSANTKEYLGSVESTLRIWAM